MQPNPIVVSPQGDELFTEDAVGREHPGDRRLASTRWAKERNPVTLEDDAGGVEDDAGPVWKQDGDEGAESRIDAERRRYVRRGCWQVCVADPSPPPVEIDLGSEEMPVFDDEVARFARDCGDLLIRSGPGQPSLELEYQPVGRAPVFTVRQTQRVQDVAPTAEGEADSCNGDADGHGVAACRTYRPLST